MRLIELGMILQRVSNDVVYLNSIIHYMLIQFILEADCIVLCMLALLYLLAQLKELALKADLNKLPAKLFISNYN